MGFLWVRFEMVGAGEGGAGKITPHPGLSTYSSEVSENIPFTIKALLTMLMSVFFLQKMTVFLAKIVPLLKATV